MRSEDVAFDAALDELLDIGEKAHIPVQISHIKLGIADRWGEAVATSGRRLIHNLLAQLETALG
jgi:hypothetical protein